MKIEQRRALFYNKYRYKATLHLVGVCRLYRVNTELEFLKRLEEQLTEPAWHWNARRTAELAALDIDSFVRFIAWRNHNFNRNRKPQNLLVRLEQDTAAIFCNDLALLQTLQTIDPYNDKSVTYVEISPCVPQGVMAFKRQPAHTYRVYFKGGRSPPGFKDDLAELIDRFNGTTSALYPSVALQNWLLTETSQWLAKYSSPGFFVDYDVDSTYSMLSLLFDKMISKRFDLIKSV